MSLLSMLPLSPPMMLMMQMVLMPRHRGRYSCSCSFSLVLSPAAFVAAFVLRFLLRSQLSETPVVVGCSHRGSCFKNTSRIWASSFSRR
jgi:hypothetical protein